MDELAVICETLKLDEDDALFVLELCDMLDREDNVTRHGYPKDTPAGRDLSELLDDVQYRARLADLASAEGGSAAVLNALSEHEP